MKTETDLVVTNQNFYNNLNKMTSTYKEILNIVINKNQKKDFFMPQMLNEYINHFFSNPDVLIKSYFNYHENFLKIVNYSINRFMGNEVEPILESEARDKRFRDPAWKENIYFDFLKQSYLLYCKSLDQMVNDLNLNEKDYRQANFVTKKFTEAYSPTNSIFSNPQVLKATLESQGENLVIGLKNLLEDLKNSEDYLKITTTDSSLFKLGENIAASKGKVVYQNDLIQLICYEPKNKSYSIPLLICPAWINKYYIFDLQDKTSFVKWLVEHNYQVFLISWVNPGAKLQHKKFEDYLQEGILDSIQYILKNFSYKKVNLLGYCVGGTLTACALSHLTKNKKNYINSATFLTTMLDFVDPGDLGIFATKQYISQFEKDIKKTGYFKADTMSLIFNLLRSNDMIWSYFVNNYLLGKKPFPMDILYWNADRNNLPQAMHLFYLKKMYQENLLKIPGGISLLNNPIDLTQINIPSFFLSTKEDHIAPWKSTYMGSKLFKGAVEFCLAGSGHVAGVINPGDKYNFWSEGKYSSDPNLWFDTAKEQSGSWWGHWNNWSKKYSGELIDSINYQNIKNFIEYAPGSYAMKSCD